MRVTTLFRRLLGVSDLFVKRSRWEPAGLILEVEPRWRRPRCGECKRVGPKEDRARVRRWRHLSFGSTRVWLEYQPRRVRCRTCDGIRVERVPWAEHASRFTEEFEQLVAYMAQISDKTSVTKLMGISWVAVGEIVERVVDRLGNPDALKNLRRIGIDEFGYRKRHRYITTVVDHDTGKIVWAGPGRSAKALAAFFELLGPEGCARIETVTIDMAGGYKRAIADWLPGAQVVFDRFHVQRLASDAVDEVRREMLRELRGTPEGRRLFKIRFSLLRGAANMAPGDAQRLNSVQKENKALYRAYLLKEVLSAAMSLEDPEEMASGLRGWISWASRSRLRPFIRVAKTIRKHLDGILAYAKERLTNGLVEGLNNKLRVIARRAYGFHSAQALIAMLHLCCGSVKLSPPLP